MTKKHFKALAAQMATIRPFGEGHKEKHNIASMTKWLESCEAIAIVCAGFCAGFKFERFYRACGWTDSQIEKSGF